MPAKKSDDGAPKEKKVYILQFSFYTYCLAVTGNLINSFLYCIYIDQKTDYLVFVSIRSVSTVSLRIFRYFVILFAY